MDYATVYIATQQERRRLHWVRTEKKKNKDLPFLWYFERLRFLFKVLSLGSAKDERRSVWGTANQRHFVSFARFLCRLYPSIKRYTSTYTFFTRELIIQRVVWESRARLGDSAVWHPTRPLLVSCFFWKHTIECVCCGNRLPCFLKQRFPAPGWLVWLFIVKFRQLIQNLFTLKKLSK